jgi:ubiquinone/menaquinone biosynthesis C-methylase UbiE
MRSTQAWRARAKADPLHAVASHPGTEGRNWDQAEFYRLGESDWADFRAHWLSYEPELSGSCLEIGCGAGRMTKQLLGQFGRVVALDVSEDMIDLARSAAPGAEYHQVEGADMPVDSNSVDAVFTCHVLQHFESKADVAASLREAFRALRPGGTIMAHLLLAERVSNPLTHYGQRLRSEIALRLKRGARPTVARRYYPGELRELVEKAGFGDVTLVEFRVAYNDDPHAFWLGRKPSG